MNKWTERAYGSAVSFSTVVLVAATTGLFIYGIDLPYQLVWWSY